jgi:hypothetical protein
MAVSPKLWETLPNLPRADLSHPKLQKASPQQAVAFNRSKNLIFTD